MNFLCMKIIKFGEDRVQAREVAKFSTETDALEFARNRTNNDIFVINCNSVEVAWLSTPEIEKLEYN